jgi:alkylated DNA repair dioxygenase AlkB
MGSAASFIIAHSIRRCSPGDVKSLCIKVEGSSAIPQSPCLTNDTDSSSDKDDGIRAASSTNKNERKPSRIRAKTVPNVRLDLIIPKKIVDNFDDSSYHKSWLSDIESEALFQHLKIIGEEKRPRNGSSPQVSMKYPLWALYYGIKRQKDNAIAVDRWGSPYESLLRVEEPSVEIIACCEKLKKSFGLKSSSINSIVVNYYFDGDTTFIPGHRDSVACLEENSSIYCLSLGATRSFILADNAYCGQSEREKIDVAKEWRVGHGDLFSLGPQTNENYCHTVPIEPALKSMRISVIFRTVSKSFVDFNGPVKTVNCASDTTKEFSAELITTDGFNDPGLREHVADLIQIRENDKRMEKFLKKYYHEILKEVVHAKKVLPRNSDLMDNVNRLHDEIIIHRTENRKNNCLNKSDHDQINDQINKAYGDYLERKEMITEQLALKNGDVDDDHEYYMGNGTAVPIHS